MNMYKDTMPQSAVDDGDLASVKPLKPEAQIKTKAPVKAKAKAKAKAKGKKSLAKGKVKPGLNLHLEPQLGRAYARR